MKQKEYQQLVVDAGALPCLVDWLRMQKISTIAQPLIDLLKRVADAITSLAHENTGIKTLVRFFSFFHTLKNIYSTAVFFTLIYKWYIQDGRWYSSSC